MKVILYTVKDCSVCNQVKETLLKKGIEFEEQDPTNPSVITNLAIACTKGKIHEEGGASPVLKGLREAWTKSHPRGRRTQPEDDFTYTLKHPLLEVIYEEGILRNERISPESWLRFKQDPRTLKNGEKSFRVGSRNYHLKRMKDVIYSDLQEIEKLIESL